KLLVGIDHEHFLGLVGPATVWSTLVLGAGCALLVFLLYRYARSADRTAAGLAGRVFGAVVTGVLLWLVVNTVLTSGRPGTLVVTIVYVAVDVTVVDGANRLQVFWRITFPLILPATSTVVLIRLIEGFKIVDLPNVLTNGGPGTATESLTLHAYTIWRALDIGGSAAVAYMLLIVVTFVGVSYVNLFRRRVTAMA